MEMEVVNNLKGGFKKIPLNVPLELHALLDLLVSSESFIAGGAVRAIYQKEPIRDLDIFTKNLNTFAQLKADLTKAGFEQKFENAMLTRFTQSNLTIDAVKPRKEEFLKTDGTPEEVLAFFDFTVARGAILDKSTALVDVRFEDDCQQKRIHIEHIVCPLALVRRIGKYTTYGYKASLIEISKLFVTFMERDNQDLLSLLGRNDLSKEDEERLMKWVYVD